MPGIQQQPNQSDGHHATYHQVVPVARVTRVDDKETQPRIDRNHLRGHYHQPRYAQRDPQSYNQLRQSRRIDDRRTIWASDSPKFLPAFTCVGATFRTALMEVTAMGRNDARKIRKMAARSPTPNHNIEIGIHANGEIGRKNSIRWFSISRPGGNNPASGRTESLNRCQQVAPGHAE